MSFILYFINWDVDPAIFSIGSREIRYYSLAFVLALFLGVYLIKKMFRAEGKPEEWGDKMLSYVGIGILVGARLGHCLFYSWDYYSQNLWEILYVWKGGLASHGGAIGIIIAVWLFSKKVTKLPMLWTFDRLVIVVALGGAFIRLGNLMNSEIYGIETDLPWGFIFLRNGETVPKHPTQIYEALCYFIIFLVGMWLYWKKDMGKREGFLMGFGITTIFGTRSLIEFIKNDQVASEATMLINKGQQLSIPFILIGIYLMYRAFRVQQNTGIKR